MTPREQERHTWSYLFASVLHIRPWEADLLTVEQFDQLVGALKAQQRADAKALAEIRRQR